jgi:DNA-binding CsgD family transcriptional regulator
MNLITLENPDFRRFSEALEKLYTPTELAQFPALAFEVVAMLVHDPVMSMEDIELGTGQHVASLNFEVDEAFLATLAENLLHDHPGIQHVANGGPMRSWRLTDLISLRELRETGLYAEQFKAAGVKYQLAVMVESPGHVLGVAINRGTDFSEIEEQMVRALASHLNHAHANACLYTSLLQKAEKTPQFSATALLKVGITAREAETLQWMIEGKRNLEIAIILGISVRTVEKHVGSILAKLHCETRTAAVVRAQEILQAR